MTVYINVKELRTMDLLTLIRRIVSDTDKAQLIKELGNRMGGDPNLAPYLSNYGKQPEPQQAANTYTRPSTWPEIADEILSSRWNYSDGCRWTRTPKHPDDVQDFVRQVSNGYITEDTASQGQIALWSSVKSFYREAKRMGRT